uniref:Uncharacterized protein n=1 Tax=Leptobrachium leishanense TaxID=445787 RepID=A0A8C5MJP8_9ANUR
MALHGTAAVIPFVLLSVGFVLSKRCPPSKSMLLAQGMKFNLHMSICDHESSSVYEAHARSLSPWNYSLTEDKNRFPAIIAEATCTHEECVDPSGNVDPNMVSVPIKQETLVLRRHEEGSSKGIFLDKQIITAGCTCVWPETHERN